MEIQGLPATGCNVFYGNYVDNYNGSTRIRYYIYEGQAVENSTATSTTRPTGSVCMTTTPEYKPELNLYICFGAAIAATGIILLAYNIIIGRIMRR